MNNKYTYFFLSLVLVVGVFMAGSYYGFSHRPEVEKALSLIHKEPQVETTADFESFWKVWNTLNEKSIYAKKVSDQDRVWGAVQGLASSLGDPYTVFFSPEENKLFNDTIKGTFGGIGAEIGLKDKVLTIISPLKGTPAWNAGIKSGDKILKIDKKETTDMTIDKAISLIRGEKGTTVALTVFRPGEKQTREFSMIRETISLPTIDTELRKDNIFVITFYSFSANSGELFKKALEEFMNSRSDKLILDLRGNPGGYLDIAISISSLFIDQGKTIVIEDYGEGKEQEVYRSRGTRLFDKNLKMIILVDGGSASASEILAGALQEHGIAKLVGEKTFGKGSVQELVKITDDTSLKVTIAKWLTPNGISTSDHGLTPDFVVPITDKDFNAKIDPQLNKAIQLLTAKP